MWDKGGFFFLVDNVVNLNTYYGMSTTQKFSLSNITLVGQEGYTEIPAGQYAGHIKSIVETTAKDKQKRFVGATPQVEVTFALLVDGVEREFKAWYNLAAYARPQDIETPEIKALLNAVDAKLAKKLGFATIAEYKALSNVQKMDKLFERVLADEQDGSDKAVEYLIARTDMTLNNVEYSAGERVMSQARSAVAHDILAKLCTHAGVLEPGDQMSGEDVQSIEGKEIGVEIKANGRGKARVNRTMYAKDVSDSLV